MFQYIRCIGPGIAGGRSLADYASKQEQGHHHGGRQYDGKFGAMVHKIMTRRDRQTVALLRSFPHYMSISWLGGGKRRKTPEARRYVRAIAASFRGTARRVGTIACAES